MKLFNHKERPLRHRRHASKGELQGEHRGLLRSHFAALFNEFDPVYRASFAECLSGP
jgi:hypothetical protein